MKKIVLFLAICVGIPFLLLKCMGNGNGAETITVRSAYTHPTMGELNTAAVFMEIQNRGIIPDSIVSAETPLAGRAELHENIDDGGVMRMRKLDSLELLPGQTVILKSGGTHVMLFDLKRPLKLHERFPLTLHLKSGMKIPLQVRVEERELIQN